MLRNPPNFFSRAILFAVVIAVIREMSIRRNADAMSEWPRQSDTSDEAGQ